jgi:hypothetical protein
VAKPLPAGLLCSRPPLLRRLLRPPMLSIKFSAARALLLHYQPGGTAPDTQLTPEVLANMSEKEFEALYNELMESGNKEKLMQIFGH